MINKETIAKQNLNDLLSVVIVLSDIIRQKELTQEDERRIKYCTRNIKQVTEKQKILNG